MAEVISFPSRKHALPFEVNPCPLCDVSPEVRCYSEDGYHATCICPSCGAGSLPKGTYYAETKDDAVQRAIAQWHNLVNCAYGEDYA